MKRGTSKQYDKLIKESEENHSRNNSGKFYKTFAGLNKDILMGDVKSLSELSVKSGVFVDRTTLSKYIKGDTIPPIDVVIKLALFCRVTVDELLVGISNIKYKPALSHVKDLILLKNDYTYARIEDADGKPKTIDLSNYTDRYNVNPFLLDFDSLILKAPKGSIILGDFFEEDFDGLFTGEFYAILKNNTLRHKVEYVKDGKTRVRYVTIERLYPSLVKRVKNDDDLIKVSKNIVSYTDINGETRLTTLKNFNDIYYNKIVRIIRDL